MAARQELIEFILGADESLVVHLKPMLQKSLAILSWQAADISGVFPNDAIQSVASFLEVRDLVAWQSCNSRMMSILDSMWCDIGIVMFPNIYVDGVRFDEVPVSDYDSTRWLSRFIYFHRSLRICVLTDVTDLQSPHSVVTCVPLKRISCTIPSKFSVSLAGSTYIEMTVQIKFSPDAVRSVIGLIDVPAVPLGKIRMDCDRGLSRKHWGLAFGPLTGVVSTQGRYFDNFSTYRAHHGLKDYLTMATFSPVQVKVGIFISDGKVAFYRLPETDYPDWECTGFIYDCFDTIAHSELLLVSQVYPSLMFSSIGPEDTISVSIDKISSSPPYMPHTNTTGLNSSNWNWFAESSRARPPIIVPPNSPIPNSTAASPTSFHLH